MITTTFYLTSIYKSLYSLFLVINRGIINYVLGKLSKRGVSSLKTLGNISLLQT